MEIKALHVRMVTLKSFGIFFFIILLPHAFGKKVSFPEPQGNYSGFARSLSKTDYGYTIVQKPFPVRAGKFAERFEVRSGDCSSLPEWSDCRNDRERSELIQQAPHGELGKTYWYAWSLYVPDDYKNIFPAKVALGQFHQEGAKRPPLMFQNDKGGYWADMNQLHKSPVLLIPEDQLKGKWHDLLVSVKWTTKKNGHLKIWVDGKQKMDYSGPTVKKSEKIFFKYGIYRSFLSRAPKKTRLSSQVVYFDEVRWGNSRKAVESFRH